MSFSALMSSAVEVQNSKQRGQRRRNSGATQEYSHLRIVENDIQRQKCLTAKKYLVSKFHFSNTPLSNAKNDCDDDNKLNID